MNRFFSLYLIVILIGFVSGADIAYITKDEAHIDENIVEAVLDLEYTIEYVDDSELGFIDFSKYKIILIPNQKFGTLAKSIPVNEYNSLIMNTYHLEEWSWLSGSVSKVYGNQPPIVKVVSSSTSITQNLSTNFRVYSDREVGGTGIPLSYLSKQGIALGLTKIVSTSSSSLDSVVAKADVGTKLKNGKVSGAKGVFFGITETNYWTEESKLLFQNSVVWLIGDFDQDGDGYTSDDCDDSNPKVNPGEKEVPYDGTDQDCSGEDLVDVDGDGYISTLVGGDDCDDSDASINPGSADILKDCKKDSEVIEKILDFEINQCSSSNSNIQIKIKEPSSRDDFEIGGKIPLEVEIENKFEEKMDFDYEVYLYSLNDGELVEKFDDSVKIEDEEKETIQYEFELSDKLEEGEYLIYVFVKDEENQCQENYVEIEVKRSEHRVVVSKIEGDGVSKPGEEIELRIKVKNTGSSDEEVYLLIESSELGIDLKSTDFELEEFGEDDSEKVSLKIGIPENAEEGEYDIRVSVFYDGESDSEIFTLKVVKEKEVSRENLMREVIKLQDGGVVKIIQGMQKSKVISLEEKKKEEIRLETEKKKEGIELETGKSSSENVVRLERQSLEGKISSVKKNSNSEGISFLFIDFLLGAGIIVLGALLMFVGRRRNHFVRVERFY